MVKYIHGDPGRALGRTSPSTPEQHSPVASVQRPSHKILVIEDSPVVRLYLKHTLEAMQDPVCEVSEASNGLEGLQALEHKAFDLVFCDLDMPLLDGRDLCSILRGHGHRSQRIIIFTSDPRSRMEPQFLNDPGIIVLQKPASRLEIWDLVSQLLAD